MTSRRPHTLAIALMFSWLALPVFSDSVQGAAFVVGTGTDSHDVAPGDGQCADSDGFCSLRAAIEEAGAGLSADTILIADSVGTIKLLLGPVVISNGETVIDGDWAVIDGIGLSPYTATLRISGTKTCGEITVSAGASVRN